MTIFFKIIFMGIFLGLPFGPIGMLCMSETVEKGKKPGFYAALGAISVDIIYCSLVYLLLSGWGITDFISKYEFYLNLLIGIFVLFMGGSKVFGKLEIQGNFQDEVKHDFYKKNDISVEERFNSDLSTEKELCRKNYKKIFLLSLPNLFNMATIVGLFTTLGLLDLGMNKLVGLVYIIGVMLIGNIGLWTLTTTILGKLRDSITKKTIEYLIRICGGVIMILGLLMEYKALMIFLGKN